MIWEIDWAPPLYRRDERIKETIARAAFACVVGVVAVAALFFMGWTS